uniref:Aminotransferase-like plant mobile domain-containing protein n=1 Tax=Solanum tuberosum TaxID=4113 RepID=M1BUG3_SOLTU
MTIFRQYISPSTRLRHLIVETEEGGEQTQFFTHAPLVGQYANPWSSLKNPFHMANWTSVHTHTSSDLLKLWSLQVPDHHHANIATPLPSLGRRIIQGEIRWGNPMEVKGEYHHIPDILQAFCEVWCPKTNTLLTSVGELSISLWDLHILGGLPIWGALYEEIVPEVKELVGSDEKRIKYTPRTCEYLFAAFHHLRGANQEVSFSKWISFWCKKPQRYEAAPPREEKKSARPESTHNPSGGLPNTTRWSRIEERIFSGLGVKVDKRDETYLGAFLSCWLCAFVLPNKEGEFIRPGTFKMASLMESGKKISLAVPVLAIIYNGLNKISSLSQLNQIKVCFLIHYVYGWLAHYLKTHYAFSNGSFLATMVVYSGEGGARYFDSNDVRKCIHGGENVAWTSTMLDKTHPYFYVDNNHGKLSRSDVDSASSLRDEIQVIIKEMDCKDVDISPLKKLLNSFFDFAASYDQARSTLHDMDVENARKELFVAAGERLTNSMFEEQDKVEDVSSLRHSLNNMKKEIRALCKRAQDLQAHLAAAEDEVEGVKQATLLATQEFDSCYDVDLTNDLGQKREHLEAMRQELINSKLYLD